MRHTRPAHGRASDETAAGVKVLNDTDQSFGVANEVDGLGIKTQVFAGEPFAGGGFVPSYVAYTGAFAIYMLPHSLITVSLVTALFTRMSEHAAERNVAGVRSDLSFGLRTVGVFTVFALGNRGTARRAAMQLAQDLELPLQEPPPGPPVVK